MSMPKGHKSEHGYATVGGQDGGLDYRSIAEVMTGDGHKMNHATARNIFLRAMKKLAMPVCEAYADESAGVEIDRTARDPRFQESMIELVTQIYEEGDGSIDV